ncbi:hypothetical protein E3Q03_02401 [Wallemia mellicola]|uniref:Mitochondrial distribution and morphology protein 34 n=1 Tax=Wallemia mellicola TaxID=1708541 RepID=A0AB74KE65_9BASI|nr:hypothetical protein E3Q04_02226 [Wallemia mellicola]TIC65911.1 hypothetical protein E3Q03_02401 [Wallemia mellicola]
MAFKFQWPDFNAAFLADARTTLDNALNKGPKPPIIADRIIVEDLNMGTIPPELEILEIGELSVDKFRGIFRMNYAGDAHIVLRTKVQANPLTTKGSKPGLLGGRSILAAHQPLVVPMHLRLSALRLRAIIVLVVSKQKGITLVFKNDPLENLDVNSTFDSIAVIQKFIQQQIEGQLREMFREDLPGIIHRLSQQYFDSREKAKKSSSSAPRRSAMSANGELESYQTLYGSKSDRPTRSMNIPRRSNRLSTQSQPHSPTSSTFPDLEFYDPTYGLRPHLKEAQESLGETAFGKVWERSRGFLQPSDKNTVDDLDDIDLFDPPINTDAFEAEDDDAVSESLRRLHLDEDEEQEELNSIDDVTGSTAWRTRSSRSLRTPASDATSYISSRTATARPVSTTSYKHTQITEDTRSSLSNSRSNSFADTSILDDSTAPTSILEEEKVAPKPYNLSTSPTIQKSIRYTDTGKMTIMAPINENIKELGNLSQVNFTLSPNTRVFERSTVRSFPHTKQRNSKGIQKARRKRVHKLGGKKEGKKEEKEATSSSTSNTASTPQEATTPVVQTPAHALDKTKNIKLALWAREASLQAPKPPPSVIASTT